MSLFFKLQKDCTHCRQTEGSFLACEKYFPLDQTVYPVERLGLVCFLPWNPSLGTVPERGC